MTQLARIHRLLAALILGVAPYAGAAMYDLPPEGSDLVGAVRGVEARYEDTLLDIARPNGMGYEEMQLANPAIDSWMPGAGTLVVIPSQFILPPGPREGIVLNVPEMRIYYYPVPAKGERGKVITYPVSVGRMDWNTPITTTKVVSKIANPTWTPPESIRAEHAAKGDYLPKVVPAGPDNPLGLYAMRLGIPGYLIHGTNNPNGLGMRVTHGCMRLYPEDIQALFGKVPVGTPVRIINQAYKIGRHNGELYLEAHPPLDEDIKQHPDHYTMLVKAVVDATQQEAPPVDWHYAQWIVDHPSGMPMSIAPGGRHDIPVTTQTRNDNSDTPSDPLF